MEQQEGERLPRPIAMIPDEVQPLALDREAIVRQPIQLVLHARPVVLVPPVANEVPQHAVVGTFGPASVEGHLRPARRVDPAVQVRDAVATERNAEGLGADGHG